MNKRGLFALVIGTGLSGHAALLRAQMVAGTMRRVGVLVPSTRAKEEITLKPFFDEMRQLGWIMAAKQQRKLSPSSLVWCPTRLAQVW